MTMRRAAAAALLVLSAAYATLILRNVSYAAGGPDESGYMNEAKLLAHGRASVFLEPLQTLHLDRSFADVFTPLGFEPGPGKTMLPFYPAGYPMHLLVAAKLGGWSHAPFFITPLLAFASIVLTYAIARELGLASSWAIASAAILALYPTFVLHSLVVMSDVPAMFWALLAMWVSLRSMQRPRFALLAGAALGVAVWIRPATLLLALPLAIAMRFRFRSLLLTALGGLPFALLLMLFNTKVYGHPFSTGYGSLGGYLVFGDCFRQQSMSLLRLLTPIVLPGGLFVIFDRRVDKWHRVLIPTWFAVFLIFYGFWPSCDQWWYTRFLFAATPPLIYGAMFLIRDLCALIPRARIGAAISVVVIAAILIHLGRQWEQLHLLRIDEDQQVYPGSVRTAESVLPRNALVVAGVLSGAFYNYSGRFTARWDRIEPDRFQLLRAYAGDANLKWYAVLSDVEITGPEFARRFPGTWTKIAKYRDVTVFRFDS